jgi:CDP-4-dehydro-6-deoxyglucose reductase
MLEALYEDGQTPGEEDLGQRLIELARERHNYIPKAAEDDFAQALAREYRKYVEERMSGRKPEAVDYGQWQGHPREHIPWFPTIAEDQCDGCGACLEFCSFGVFQATEDGKVAVVEPFKCQVGCSSCVNVCPPRAITFPPRSILETFRPGRR